MSNYRDIIKAPIITEKSAALAETNHPWLSLSRFWLLPSCVCQRPYHCACDLLFSRYLGHDRDLPAL